MTYAEFIANPMAPVLVIFLVLMAGFCIALAMQDSEPTPEYTRLMAEHDARMAEWEATRPARMAAYRAGLEARRLAQLAAMNARITARLAQERNV